MGDGVCSPLSPKMENKNVEKNEIKNKNEIITISACDIQFYCTFPTKRY